MNKSIDYELIEKKDYYGLYEKYKPLINSFWPKIDEHCKRYYYDNDMKEYYSFAYENVVQAAQSVKLEKIKKPESWTFYIQLYRYIWTHLGRLQQYYYEDIVSKTIFYQDLTFDNGEEKDGLLRVEDHSEVDISMFTEDEYKVIELRLKGVHWDDIRKKLKMTGKELKFIQSSIKAKLS